MAEIAESTELAEQVVDTWRIHARIQRYVLDALDPAALTADAGIKGRSVGGQFAHIHDVRLMWVTSAAPELLEGLAKFGSGNPAFGDQAALAAALDASASAIEQLVVTGLETGRIKGFKPHPVAFVGYLVAHESYHQGDIGVRLTESGHTLDRKTAYGMWEWNSRREPDR